MIRQLVVLVLFLFSFFATSFAYVDGARSESCYDHSISHPVTIATTVIIDPSVECVDPCDYQLDVVEKIEDGGQTVAETYPKNFTFEFNTTYRCELIQKSLYTRKYTNTHLPHSPFEESSNQWLSRVSSAGS